MLALSSNWLWPLRGQSPSWSSPSLSFHSIILGFLTLALLLWLLCLFPNRLLTVGIPPNFVPSLSSSAFSSYTITSAVPRIQIFNSSLTNTSLEVLTWPLIYTNPKWQKLNPFSYFLRLRRLLCFSMSLEGTIRLLRIYLPRLETKHFMSAGFLLSWGSEIAYTHVSVIYCCVLNDSKT